MCFEYMFFSFCFPNLYHINQQIPVSRTMVLATDERERIFERPLLYITLLYHDLSGEAEENRKENLL
jgi:hypothetical protein